MMDWQNKLTINTVGFVYVWKHSRYVNSFIMLREFNSLHLTFFILFSKNYKKSI